MTEFADALLIENISVSIEKPVKVVDDGNEGTVEVGSSRVGLRKNEKLL